MISLFVFEAIRQKIIKVPQCGGRILEFGLYERKFFVKGSKRVTNVENVSRIEKKGPDSFYKMTKWGHSNKIHFYRFGIYKFVG